MKNKKMKPKCILPSKSELHKYGLSGLVASMDKYPDKFAHIRQEYKGGKSLEEWVKVAEKLEKKLGILPNPHKLRKTHCSLVVFMKKYPESFAHIKQEWKQGRSLADTIKRAEELEKEHGTLPYRNWLIEHGEANIGIMMKKYPEKFSHIKQDSKRGRTLEESVKYAEKIAKENNGFLPYESQLKKIGGSGLCFVMRKYPDAFKHIPMLRSYPSLEEAIKEAEKLEKEHGILPTSRWLSKNKKNYICTYLNKFPEKFAHIKKNKSYDKKTIEENVKIAEEIAAQNNGILPYKKELSKKGLHGLVGHLHKYPEKFAHIKQEFKGGRSDKENLELAKSLIKKNNGVLPSYSWMRQNNCGGLQMCIRVKPELFKGMKMEFGNEWNKEIKVIGA